MPLWDAQDYAQSWSPEAYYPDGGQLGSGGLYDPPGVGKKHAGGKLAWPAPDHLEPQLQDGNLTNHAVETIERMASGGYGEDVASGKRPFFLAVGFVRPSPLLSPARRRPTPRTLPLRQQQLSLGLRLGLGLGRHILSSPCSSARS